MKVVHGTGDPNGKSAEFIAEKMGISDKTVKRYIRLTYLEPWLLNMVDEEMIPLKAGVQLSYLSRQAQQYVFDVIEAENIKISEDTANMLRQNLSEHATMEDVFSLLKPMAVKTKVPRQEIKVSKNVKKTYFPAEYDDIKVNEVILTLIKSWAENYK